MLPENSTSFSSMRTLEEKLLKGKGQQSSRIDEELGTTDAVPEVSWQSTQWHLICAVSGAGERQHDERGAPNRSRNTREVTAGKERAAVVLAP